MSANDFQSLAAQRLTQWHVPSVAFSTDGCAIDDARTGDAAWKCLCRATDFRMRLVPNGKIDDNFIHQASQRLRTMLVTKGLRSMCADGKAYNPYEHADGERGTCWPHLPIYKLFPPAALDAHSVVTYKDPKLKDYALEWLGNVRRWQWDCVPNSYKVAYVAYSPMRLVDCLRGMPEQGADPPVIDEEYFEMADGLMAVAAAPIGGKFVVAELGARYAPWALRAMVAARRLGRSREFHGIVIDNKNVHVRWTQEHFRLNGFSPSQYKIYQGMAFRGDPLRGKGVDVHRLAELLSDVDHVDLLDVDVQKAEQYIIRNSDDLKALKEKVMRIHVEAHTVVIGEIVSRILVKHGFRILRNASSNMLSMYKHPHLGKVPFRSGYIFAANMRFANTLNGTC